MSVTHGSSSREKMSSIRTFFDVDLDNLEYKSPTKNAKGGTMVYMSTVQGSSDPAHRLKFQMSKDNKGSLQYAVWGLQNDMAGSDVARKTLDVTIDGELVEFLKKLDAKNIEAAASSCDKWFKKSLDKSTIENMYSPLVKLPFREGASHQTKVKITVEGKYSTKIWIVKEEGDKLEYVKGSHHDLTKGCKMMIIAESTGLWFMTKQFGCSLNATDIMVWPNRQTGGISSFVLAPQTVLSEGGDAEDSMVCE